MKSIFFMSAAIPILMLLVQNVYAGGARLDMDEQYRDIPGALDCYVNGYDDGQNNPFDQDRNEECKDRANQYYEGFLVGCRYAGNTEEICETFTDT